jgi:DNA-binding NarL/FixJ family response regulator
MIRILLVDDQSLIRRGLKALLESEDQFQVVGEAENGAEAVKLIAQLHTAQLHTDQLPPDVVLMDIQMPQLDGIAGTREIVQRFPHIRVLVLTTFPNSQYVSEAMNAGACGYLLKNTPFEDLTQALHWAMKGYTQIGPGLTPKPPQSQPIPLPEAWSQLTPREGEIIQCILQGLSNLEIAQALCLSEKTVKNNITQILSRLNLRDRTQLAITALRGRFTLERDTIE